MRFLTTRQLATLAFAGSGWAANKRLRKLLDFGAIRVWVRSLNQENVYSLDRHGMKLLGGSAAVPRALDGVLEHLLAINQARITFALGLLGIDGELANWRSDWELRGELRTRVIPDALFTVRWHSGQLQCFALEVDHRSRSTRGFLNKLLGYAKSETLDRAAILFVGHDPDWIERYRQALARTRLAGHVWFTTFELLGAHDLTAWIWRTADRPDQYSLRDLAALPYGRERRMTDSFAQAPN